MSIGNDAVLKVYNGTSWEVAIGKLETTGGWQEQLYFFDGTNWRPLFSTVPVVSLNTGGVTVSASANPCIAGVIYRSNGIEHGSSSDGTGNYNVVRGTWLDNGTNDEVWFERTIISGSLNNTDPGAGRKRMDLGSYTVAVQDTTIVGGSVTCTVKITMWDASIGGSKLDEVTYTLSAERLSE